MGSQGPSVSCQELSTEPNAKKSKPHWHGHLSDAPDVHDLQKKYGAMCKPQCETCKRYAESVSFLQEQLDRHRSEAKRLRSQLAKSTQQELNAAYREAANLRCNFLALENALENAMEKCLALTQEVESSKAAMHTQTWLVNVLARENASLHARIPKENKFAKT